MLGRDIQKALYVDFKDGITQALYTLAEEVEELKRQNKEIIQAIDQMSNVIVLLNQAGDSMREVVDSIKRPPDKPS